FFVIGDPDLYRPFLYDTEPMVVIDDPASAGNIFYEALPVLSMAVPLPVEHGQPQSKNASATIASIDRAVAFCRAGAASALVTNPINKKVLHEGAAFAYPGHTEYLAHLGGVDLAVMMMVAPGLRVVPVTVHVPVSAVPGLLSVDLIVRTGRSVHDALVRDFGVASPRLAVAGLNPHAGEGGAMGHEDDSLIRPAAEKLRAAGIDTTGPLPADTMFHPGARACYDVALTMYHDQGLIPIKTLDFARGVNVTLGLPFIRTSPDHGTAYDIAGKGIADPTSLCEAIRLAGEMAKARAA
ncbi:MAG: 4-hydroxythreonine-4-phosphate dehydrogenase PdxA, partial [Pseudomonadota bacterium]